MSKKEALFPKGLSWKKKKKEKKKNGRTPNYQKREKKKGHIIFRNPVGSSRTKQKNQKREVASTAERSYSYYKRPNVLPRKEEGSPEGIWLISVWGEKRWTF